MAANMQNSFALDSKNDKKDDLAIDIQTLEAVATKSPESECPQWIRDASPEELAAKETRLRRKIDIRLMPLIRDLHLKGYQFNTVVSILFTGYLLMQVPSNMLLNKLGRPALYLPGCMLIWGVVSGATAASQSYGGMLAARFVLGFIEAAYFPGCLYYLSCWYTRRELALRTGILYSGSLLSGAFGGLIAAGILDGMDGLHGLSAWRWLFILEACLTVGVALGAFFLLPNLPRTTRWLSAEERELASWRLQADIGEDDWIDSRHQSPLHGFRLAATDAKTWLILVVIYGSTASGSMTTFFPTVVKTLGKGNITTLLLTTPPYLIAVAACLTNAWHADRTGERYLHITLSPLLAMVMYIVAISTTKFAPRYFAMCIMVGSTYSGYVVALGYISNILPRPASKRAACLALMNSLSNVCQIYSPYLYPKSAAPRYATAFGVNIAMSAMTVIAATGLRFYLARLNKKLDRGEHVRDVSSSGAAGNDGFRFLL
ncbi:pantothenate transporter liz1 [Grosmannia clavigera kw1407]|uniref:Pantothenate transporter liz1 n=1 Tax=Grosmannia clavigera (strain kw1407 / UAMH 11150) TaxID=655863 RepID=F0XT53_GROCL|nr:pantothenate transporter liz1 [Grosmannia clavigera kw1407]EFW99217.1 pantothenate transporter liz1 [Grosmannia clavigera kw1407]